MRGAAISRVPLEPMVRGLHFHFAFESLKHASNESGEWDSLLQICVASGYKHRIVSIVCLEALEAGHLESY